MPLVIYTLWRLGLLAIAFVLLSWAGMRGWLLAVVAVLAAALLSYAFLGKPRDDAALYLVRRREQAVNRIVSDEDADFEDAQVEESAADTELPADPTSQNR